MRDVFLTFLRLGLTSFGGPLAHLSYFRGEFVERRRWIEEGLFAQIVGFCSILPGPTSSQVGMVVGLLRAGPAGAFAAWLGFTLPSAVALTLFAALLSGFERTAPGATPAWLDGMLAGLTAAATAIVAQAVLALARTQCTEAPSQTIAAAAGVLALSLAPFPGWQWVPIAGGALAGAVWHPRREILAEDALGLPIRLPRRVALGAAAAFAALVSSAALVSGSSTTGTFFATIVRAGSLVFGGGHVVLPLLQSLIPAGLVPARDFYAGYGATQAVPGPLFTFAAFLGEVNRSPLHGALGALVATVLIFLPSFLLIFAGLPLLGALGRNNAAAGALRGANASVVGLLGALLYSPLILALGTSIGRIAIALAVFTLVGTWRVAPWVAVLAAALVGAVAANAGLWL